MIAILGGLLTFVGLPIAAGLAASCAVDGRLEKLRAALIFAGCGPLALALFLETCFRFAPGLAPGMYLAACAAFSLVIAGLGVPSMRVALELVARMRARTGKLRRSWPTLAVWTVVIAVAGSTSYTCLTIPLTDHDPLQYATMARIFQRERSVDIYPFVKAEAQTGFYAVSNHPLAYHMLLTWGMLLGGNDQDLGLGRLVNPTFAVATAAALCGLLAHRPPIVAGIAALLALSAPGWIRATDSFSIDVVRTYGMVAAVGGTLFLCERRRPSLIVLAGCGLAAALGTHALGLLVLPIVFLIVVLLGEGALLSRSLALATAVAICLLLAGARYIDNFRRVGSPVSDTPPVWQLPGLSWQAHVARERQLDRPLDRVTSGALQIYTSTGFYSYASWFVPLATLIAFRRRSIWERGPVLAAVSFQLIAIALAVAGDSQIIGSQRYMLMAQPFAATSAALVLGEWYELRLAR